MSLIQKFKDFIVDAERTEAEAAKAAAELAKRSGVVVSRPVLNGAEWEAWAKASGVPSPLAAADLHVTIIYSSVDVKMVPSDGYLVIPVDRAVFAMFGPDEDNFVVAFQDWRLSDRHWTYLENGAVSTWPTFRPHMTLSNAAKGFEVPDAALRDAPEYIVLGPEVAGPVKGDTPVDDQNPEGADQEGEAVILVIEIAMSAAAKELARTDLNPVDATALYDISKGRKVSAGVAKRLASVAPDVVAALGGTKGTLATSPQETRKRAEHDITLRLGAKGAEILKSAGIDEMVGSDEEQRLIYHIANVYTVKGKTVLDADDEGFTTPAMEEFIAQVLKKDDSSTFEHEGVSRATVVQGFVMSDEVQKALGIDLGFECLLAATQYPDQGSWAEAKKSGEWSIAGRFWYYEDDK